MAQPKRSNENNQKNTETETCANCAQAKPLVLYRQYPDGHKDGLCKTCAGLWLDSDEEFPPSFEHKSYRLRK